MTLQIAILGLRQIGASIGLRLGQHPERFRRIGYDSDLLLARDARRYGALDAVRDEPHGAVEDADLVLLCLPSGEMRQAMESIAPALKAGSVVMDTAPMKSTMEAWANELLPEGCSYIGLVPVFNPAYLQGEKGSPEAAHADLFEGGLMLIGASAGVAGEALHLASDLTQALGASPLYADLTEMDGLVAATRILPRLMATALLHATANQPGWREGRKVAGRAYAEVSAPATYLDEWSDLGEALLQNSQNVVRVLDDAIAALQRLREGIARQDAQRLEDYLSWARQSRETWWMEKQGGNGESPRPLHIPSLSERIQRLLFGSLGKPPEK